MEDTPLPFYESMYPGVGFSVSEASPSYMIIRVQHIGFDLHYGFKKTTIAEFARFVLSLCKEETDGELESGTETAG